MFHTLTSVQRGEAVPLQKCIDNCNGDLRVGLRSITYCVGWFNIPSGESFSWGNDGSLIQTAEVSPGLYSWAQLRDLLKQIHNGITLEVSRVNGLITLKVNHGWAIRLTDGILTLLGLDDGLSGKWLTAGNYSGDRPVNFTPTKMLYLHLEQINTTSSIVDGAPSSLLCMVGIKCHSFGDIHTVRFEHPEFKHLRAGTIHELEVKIRDDTGQILDNHDLSVSLVLEVRK